MRTFPGHHPRALEFANACGFKALGSAVQSVGRVIDNGARRDGGPVFLPYVWARLD
jgi:hypothetical protein